jgi:hypothetical protein
MPAKRALIKTGPWIIKTSLKPCGAACLSAHAATGQNGRLAPLAVDKARAYWPAACPRGARADLRSAWNAFGQAQGSRCAQPCFQLSFPLVPAIKRRMTQHRIGIIGGSGLYHIEGFTNQKWVTIKSPFGAPSDSFLTGRLAGREVVFLPRHGRGHRILPSELRGLGDQRQRGRLPASQV